MRHYCETALGLLREAGVLTRVEKERTASGLVRWRLQLSVPCPALPAVGLIGLLRQAIVGLAALLKAAEGSGHQRMRAAALMATLSEAHDLDEETRALSRRWSSLIGSR